MAFPPASAQQHIPARPAALWSQFRFLRETLVGSAHQAWPILVSPYCGSGDITRPISSTDGASHMA